MKSLNINLKDLKISRNELNGKIDISKQIYDCFVFYSPCSCSVKTCHLSFKNRKFPCFIKKISDFVNDKQFPKNKKIKSGVYCPLNMNFDYFFRSIRNCLAHGNIVRKGKYFYLYQFVSFKQNDFSEDILEKDIKFLLVLNSIDDLDKIYSIFEKFVSKRK